MGPVGFGRGPYNLQSAENRLVEMQTLHRLGRYSVHPEEMLEATGYALTRFGSA